MAAPLILLTRTLPPSGMAALATASAAGLIRLVQWKEDRGCDRAWLLSTARQAREAGGGVAGVVCMLTDKIDNEFMTAAGPSLKIVSTMSAGTDHIDTKYVSDNGIKLGSTPDALTDATADIAVMLVLMASRRAGEAVRAVVEGKWPSMPWSPLLLCGGSLQRSRVGILGFGKIGQATLRRLVPFGISSALYLTSVPGRALAPEKDYFNLLGPAPYAPVSPTSLIPITPAKSIEDLVSNVDFLIITCSLSPATHHLISLPLLKQMKPSSYVINIARGPIVKTDDLLVAIETGLIAGAGLDVVEGEPNIGGEDTEALVKERRVVVLPHLGSATHVVRDTMGLQAVEFVLQSL